jgi:hypothetical protein
MKKFRNRVTGCIEEVTNKMLIEQYEKHTERYEEVKEATEPTLKELKAQADALGLVYPKKVTKEELLELLTSNENE